MCPKDNESPYEVTKIRGQGKWKSTGYNTWTIEGSNYKISLLNEHTVKHRWKMIVLKNRKKVLPQMDDFT